MKGRPRKRFSGVDRKPRSSEESFAAPKEEWDLIPQELFDIWIDRMNERMQAAIDAKGGHAKW